MSKPQTNSEQRVLVLAPTGKDGSMTEALLQRAGIACLCCRSMAHVLSELEIGAGAIVLVEEAILGNGHGDLVAWVERQAPWSDFPFLILARPRSDSTAAAPSMEKLGNVTLLERPTRVAALVSAVRTALRARQRQYQIRDAIAERERSAETQALLAAIVASSDDAIISKTLDGVILTWNAGAERLFGYTAEEAIGRSITMLIPEERLEEEPTLLARLRRGERIDHFETVRVTKDGRQLDISLTVSPIQGPHGKILGASKVARDITQRKQSEAKLLEADRRKDEFLAILAHELRNPLAPIRNSLHILRMTGRKDVAVEKVTEMMERQVNHMVRLVDDLMEVSRITRGKVQIRKEPIEIAGVVRSALETSRPLIESAKHELTVALPTEPLTLDGDAVRLTQVLANLLNNAAKYTDPGGRIWLGVKRDGGEVTISVRDSGSGIPPEMLPRVFDMFMQVERTTNRAQGGLGIGLTLVKTLVEMHGGRVSAHSDGPGRGSEFVVRLPLVTGASTSESTAYPLRTQVALTSRRVLVVDDNRDAADSLAMLLRLIGVEVRVVYCGQDALKSIEEYRPAVVLLDIGMPGMDGYEVSRRIRKLSGSGSVTLIALTGWGQEIDRNRSQAAGFDHHLIKPADVDKLKTILMSLDAGGAGRAGSGV